MAAYQRQYPEVEIAESELSGGSLTPTAPPRNRTRSGGLMGSNSGSPPRYDAVVAADSQARRVAVEVQQDRGRNFQNSMAHAGK